MAALYLILKCSHLEYILILNVKLVLARFQSNIVPFFWDYYYFLLPLDTQACQLILHHRNSKGVEKGLTGQAPSCSFIANFPLQGHPTTVFCEISVWRSKYCLEFFNYLRVAKNFWMNVPLMYNFWSLSNKFIMIFWSLIFTFHLLVRLFFMEKRKTKISDSKCDGERNQKMSHFCNTLNCT